MMHRLLAAAAIALMTSTVAHAGLVFDTITGNSPSGTSGKLSDQSTIMAASFTDTGAPNFTSISLMLAADNPADNGSVQVYLAPDDGAGGAKGVAGNPDGSGAMKIASISDNSLTKLSAGGTKIVTLSNVLNSIGKITANNEYWVELLPQSSSVEWAYNTNGQGVNTANQASLTDVSGVYPDDGSSSIGAGAFEMRVVDAPEPATVGLLGAGLAGLGTFRRQKLMKV